MFGYIKIDKMELKIKEYYSYRGYYCGLCMALKEKYNNLSRLTLNYDMTFLIILLSSLYEVQNKSSNERCITHPGKKHLIIQNEITEYVAGLNVILSYFNLKDNWNDERDAKSLVAAGILERQYKNASLELKVKSDVIEQRLENITKLEKENTENIDDVANEFGHLMAEMMLYKTDVWENTLRKIGFYLGKYIYLMDAYEDVEKDKKNNSYNPFSNVNVDEIDKIASDILMLNLSFLSEEIEKLPLKQDKGIIDNVIYSGMLSNIKITKEKKEKINERSI